MKTILTLLASLSLGFLIWRIDSQPNWDDTGVTVGLIVLSTGVVGFINPGKPYLTALAVTFWIPLFGILNSGNYATLPVLLFGFIGAYGGSLFRTKVLPIS